MAEETLETVVDEAPPKSKEEMRNTPHGYIDANGNNDWCAVCGRSEGWQAHTVKEPAKESPKKVQTPAVPHDAVTAPLPPPPIPDESLDPSTPLSSRRSPRS